MALYSAGIDIGSTYTKCAITDGENILGHSTLQTGAGAQKAADTAMSEALAMAGLDREQIGAVLTTGYGRRIIKEADSNISEISANARGAAWFGKELGTIGTIIDIGGQDTKVIALKEDGAVRDFLMNDKCAAGTGRFLEVIARSLGATIDDLGEMSLRAKGGIDISATCTVFARSEVASMLSKGIEPEEIAHALHRAIAKRSGVMARKVGLREQVFFDGGPARNIGMRKALESELGMKLVSPDKPQIVTAIGASLLARERKEGGQ